MIKFLLGPGFFRMAALALLTEITLVFVLMAVTGDTGRFNFFAERVILVATLATQLGMPCTEREVRVGIVIKT